VESATVARSAWSRAVAAQRAADFATAAREARRAADAWPTQPAYVWGAATMAARAHDTAAVLRALTDYAALGLGRDLRTDPAIAPLLSLPQFARIGERHDANRAPTLGSSNLRAMHPDTTFWPEGVDYDRRTTRFYLASVRHRTIAEIGVGGTIRELWPRDKAGIGAVLGVRVDSARRVLWATTSSVPQMHGFDSTVPPIAALLRVDILTGRIEQRWDLPPVPRGHVLGDVAVGPRGDIWFSDSNDPVLYRLRAGADTLERMTSPLFRSLQGIAPTPDGRVVYIADYSHGLLRLDVATGNVTRVADAPGTTALGCDGIVWHHGSIIAVQNGVAPARIVRFALDSAGLRVTRAEVLDQSQAADEPTIGAVVGDQFIYVATSQWEKHTEDGIRRPGEPLRPALLLAVPIRF
jgi:sugar lactone lactonase YvrE